MSASVSAWTSDKNTEHQKRVVHCILVRKRPKHNSPCVGNHDRRSHFFELLASVLNVENCQNYEGWAGPRKCRVIPDIIALATVVGNTLCEPAQKLCVSRRTHGYWGQSDRTGWGAATRAPLRSSEWQRVTSFSELDNLADPVTLVSTVYLLGSTDIRWEDHRRSKLTNWNFLINFLMIGFWGHVGIAVWMAMTIRGQVNLRNLWKVNGSLNTNPSPSELFSFDLRSAGKNSASCLTLNNAWKIAVVF